MFVPGETYNDNSAGDGDSRQHAVGDGVWFDGVLDALIVTVNASLIWLVHDGHDDERQSSFMGNRNSLIRVAQIIRYV